MLAFDEIKAIHSAYWKPGFGTVKAEEAAFIQQYIERNKPEIFVEVGVTTGLSSAFILMFLAENGGKTLHSIDINEMFFGDRTKATGFLVDAIGGSGQDLFKLHLKKSAFDLEQILNGAKFDMAFIDAHHGHPWPTIDTMALLPFAKPGALIFHHELALYKQKGIGIGPKYLFDQFDMDERQMIDHPSKNIGFIRVPQGDYNYRASEAKLLSALDMPWTIPELQPAWSKKFQRLLKDYWSESAVAAFVAANERYNKALA